MVKNTLQAIFSSILDHSPLGTIWVATSDLGLVAVQIGNAEGDFYQRLAARFGVALIPDKSRNEKTLSQIQEYLRGERNLFDLAIHWETMSNFQQKALKAVYQVPYGETRSYGQIAAQIGIPQAPRAVGRANATNPIPLVIPCHRLVGADGSLRGYAGGEGIKTKQWLLELEQSNA